ncbi:retrovirus-related pol polyprotein from transposon TNT 1-94 [Tanacetum coccineum]
MKNHLEKSHKVILFTVRCTLSQKGEEKSNAEATSNRGNHRSSSSKGKFADVECYHCHKKGHTMKFCRQLKKENKKKNYNNQKNKHKKDDDSDDNTEWSTLLMRFKLIPDVVLRAMLQHEKIIIHLTHQIKRHKYYLNGLLDEDGYHNSSGNGLWKVRLGSLIVAREKRESKLYMTHSKISKSIVNVVDNDDMTELWHKRLGHMSEKGMFILSNKNGLSEPRPDLAHAVSVVSRFLSNPGEQFSMAIIDYKSMCMSDNKDEYIATTEASKEQFSRLKKVQMKNHLEIVVEAFVYDMRNKVENYWEIAQVAI